MNTQVNNQESTDVKEKRVVTKNQFEIEVEKETAHLMYFERMKKDEAITKAREVIAELFEVK